MMNVDKRQWMIDMRNALGLSREKMARACKCSEKLLQIIEDFSAITQPKIAARIARMYGMDVHQYNLLVHPERRARVLPAWRDPPRNTGFTYTGYYKEFIEKSTEKGAEAI